MKLTEAAKKIIGAVAPTLATAFLGPLAGAATAEVVRKFGGEAEANEAIAAGQPEVFVKLREAELDFQKFLKDHDLDLEKIHAADRANARAMQMATKDWVPKFLAIALVISWVATQLIVIFVVVPPDNRELVARALGTLDTLLGMVFMFHYGSSVGSKQKTEMMGK